MTHFYIENYDEAKDSISLTYLQENGDTIRTYSTWAKETRDKLNVKSGGNMFTWRMDYPPAKGFEGMILWWGSLNGPIAKPGKYKVILNRNGQSQTEEFEILQNPNSESSPADIEAQFDFIQSINKKINESHQAIMDIRSLKAQIKAYTDKIDEASIKKYSADMDSIMTAVENNLYQTKNRSGQDPLNYPIKLTNKLAHLNALIGFGTQDFRPTEGMIAVRNELTALIDDQLADWTKVKTEMLPQLNTLIKEKALDVIMQPKE